MPQAITRYAIIVMVLIGFSASVYACNRATDAQPGASKLERLATGEMAGMDFAFAGEPAPPDVFRGPSGDKISLADFRGQTVLLNLWATWCPPCEAEMPSLAALQTARGGEQFVVLALSVDDMEDREFAKDQLAKLTGGVLEFYQSEDLAITYSLGASGFPTSILYGPDGQEIARYQGDTDWAGYEAIAMIDAIISK